ncbi:PD-(D/E)XK nuclease domain-containing protein [Chryseobacterium piscium]|uniref:PD-(D/E)XK nuclease domain-containing protein n=1 Tax=Chryseobacterium piscium TaxID=333702 RepID=UPI0037437B10
MRESEVYYHANVFLILKLLGFEIVTEESTNIERIDADINFNIEIFIVKFKFPDDFDDSQHALDQILTKDYAVIDRIDNVDIYGLGVSFNSKIRNIRNYKLCLLYI